MKTSVKTLLILGNFFLCSFANSACGQSSNNSLPKPYHPEANAKSDIEKIIHLAKKEHKNVMIQAGGNWCIWC